MRTTFVYDLSGPYITQRFVSDSELTDQICPFFFSHLSVHKTLKPKMRRVEKSSQRVTNLQQGFDDFHKKEKKRRDLDYSRGITKNEAG